MHQRRAEERLHQRGAQGRLHQLTRRPRAGLQAWVWTVNDELRARELQALGIDGICTDDPELIQG
ncbi:glycerophosphodiester phosphodiesterase family protein, partial [Streptomyces olivaceus]|uniref:glycerophosphodiester phosphodiesterase family protein n=1 Tax=Streptomyces olivaceus TaxID=47716 RepID=UPI0036397BED